MDKIIILGCPGSGKSTLARKLHAVTGLPLFHLDNIWWNPDGTHITREEFAAKQAEITGGTKWIIDGNYGRTYEIRMAACDTVIVLDYGEDVCLAGIKERIGRKRSDLPWVEKGLDPEFAAHVKEFREKKMPFLWDVLSRYPDKDVHVFTSREEAEKWLESLRSVR